MKPLNKLHTAILIIFAIINGAMLYLFLMQLPYGIEPLRLSLAHWADLSPQIQIALGIAVAVAVVAIMLPRKIGDLWKNRLVYLRKNNSHPAHDSFLTTRKQPFESNDLLAAYPAIKDAAFNPDAQVQLWNDLQEKFADEQVVLNTRIHWEILRDIFILSLVFLTAFLLGWLVLYNIPFQIVSTYVFLFGAQAMFLFFSARRMGFKLVDNVLATALGIGKGETLESSKKNKRKK